MPGLLLIISGPSGVGKTTITHAVEQRLGGVFSVSMTTRPRTRTDREGVDYYFVDADVFNEAIEAGDLLEHARVFDNFYGTPRKPVEKYLADGKLVILEIDVDGAKQIKKNFPDAFAVFVYPPDEATLLRRLRKRKREDEATIQRRFARAQHEIAEARKGAIYDASLVNHDGKLDDAVEEAVRIVEAERARRGTAS